MVTAQHNRTAVLKRRNLNKTHYRDVMRRVKYKMLCVGVSGATYGEAVNRCVNCFFYRLLLVMERKFENALNF